MFGLRRKLPAPAATVRCASVVLLVLAGFLSGIARASALDLFAVHQVTAQFATPAGKPLADARVQVFAPGEPAMPAATGRTDSQGKFVFDADRDGIWTAEARTAAEVARVMIRVGGPAGQQQHTRLPMFVVIGGLIVLVALAWWYQILRARSRRPRP